MMSPTLEPSRPPWRLSSGVPGIVFSLGSVENSLTISDYAPAASVAHQMVQAAIQQPLPAGTLLNVNIPMLPADQILGFRSTRLGLRVYRDRLERREDPRGRPYYWMGGDIPTGIPENGTDVGALCEGYVSLTPLQLDLTAYHAFKEINQWELPVNQTITNRLPILNQTLLHR